MSVEEILKLAVQYRADSIRVGDVEVRMNPAAFHPPVQESADPADDEDPRQCSCGHSLDVEHSEDGIVCAYCPPGACGRKKE